jgi:C1A family cysteine protease
MATKRRSARYGWIPDLPDHRDHLFAATPEMLGNLPPAVDLRAACPAVYDQGDLGSCTANAIAGAIQFEQIKQALATTFEPSRLFIYYNERAIEGTVDSDSGAMIRDGIKSVAAQGAPPETDWPYDVAQFAVQPPPSAYADAAAHKLLQYQRVWPRLNQFKSCLAAGFPFVFGFTVYESFESDTVTATGVVPMPSALESALGGHAVMAVGYDDSQTRLIVRNSWGSGWGQAGYFTMPYAYVLDSDLASDFWTLRSVA